MTNTDKTVSTERLADARVRFIGAKSRVDDEEMVEVPADYLDEGIAAFTELLASRTQEPAEPFAYTTPNIVEGFSDPRTIVGSIWPKRTAGDYATIPLYLTPPAPERSKEEVGVKPLEWLADGPGRWGAASILGHYEIYEDEGYFAAHSPQGHIEDFKTREQAKAAAQADYEQRILSALEPASLHKEEAVCPDCKRHVMSDPAPATGWVAKCGRRLTRLPECGSGVECEASPAPLPVTITPDPAFLHGVCDSLRAAISEYEDRGLYPGARKIMQAQIDTLTAALSKPGEQG